MDEPPHPGSKTLSPAFTEFGIVFPVFVSLIPGPVAITVASGRGDAVEDEGKNKPLAVFSCGLKRCTRILSSVGKTLLMLRIVVAILIVEC